MDAPAGPEGAESAAMTAEPSEGVPAKPACLAYPDSLEEYRLGSAVYLCPLVQTEAALPPRQKDDGAMRNYEDFIHIATGLLGGPQDLELDPKFLKKVWDESEGDAEDCYRADYAINTLLSIWENEPTAGLIQPGSTDFTHWKDARRLLVAQQVRGTSTKHLVFWIEPPLPEGLTLAEKTGVISGVPTVSSPKQAYKVHCQGDGKEVCAFLEFEIFSEAAPKGLVYNNVEKAYLVGHPVAIVAKVKGHVKKWSVRPDLPEGLRIDKISGAICGMPKYLTAESTWTVLAKNDLGSVSTKLTFAVVRAPPSNLKYHNHTDSDPAYDKTGFCGKRAAQEFPVNRELCLRPTIDGEATAFKVQPEMPEGLGFDPVSGVISGTPAKEVPTAAYTIVADNESGSCKTALTFSIKVLPTIAVSYPGIDEIYSVGEIFELEPQVVGGASSWVVEPQLPSGLSLDPSTGAISGAPTVATDEESYTVTASNEAGGTSTVITFSVISLPPAGLSYPGVVPEYFTGVSICLEPEVEVGKGAVTYFVDPPLPEGLSLSADTGCISGTPDKPSEHATYKVSAQNNLGKIEVEISFACLQKRAMPEPEAVAMAAAVVRKSVESAVSRGSVSRGSVSSAAAAAAAAAPAAAEASPKLQKVAEDEPAAVADEGPREEEKKPSFGQSIDNVVDLKTLPEEPDKDSRLLDWMLWMVHRAWLDDPTLTSLSFKGLDMPLPNLEPRLAPKLMKALGVNSHITSLDLSDSNLQNAQGLELADALGVNMTLQVINIDCNHLEMEALLAIAKALRGATGTKLTVFQCTMQQELGTSFGKLVEQEFAITLERNLVIKKLNMPFEDLHWKAVVEKCLKRNSDSERRRLKRHRSGRLQDNEVATQERVIRVLNLLVAPEKVSAQTIIQGNEEEKLAMVKNFTAARKRLPTKEQLQAYAKNNGQPLKYSEVAPISKAFRAKLLDAIVGCEVTAVDTTQKKTTGTLVSWAEKNDHWRLNVETQDGARFRFTALREPPIEVAPAIADWLNGPPNTE